ncbi:MAG: DUF4193 family protein [Acidimicrobiia bacterium]|nr:DUF4193 family protein [Acidimicrobiia bacterium]
MSNDEITFEDEAPDELLADEPMDEDLFDDDAVDEDALLEEDDSTADDDDDVGEDDAAEPGAEGDTEALDDLEAEELEMLTEDEASETIVVDEETQLRDIRRAQISIEASSAGGASEDEFVCSVCFLVKKSSQLANRRRKICLDCAG